VWDWGSEGKERSKEKRLRESGSEDKVSERKKGRREESRKCS
jgi:hypothetical protein